MKYVNDNVEISDIVCIPFEVEYFQEYMRIYNTKCEKHLIFNHIIS